MDAIDLINAFGGTATTARMFGVRPSAVSNWKAANRFPERLHLRVSREAAARSIDLPNDFFDFDPPAADAPTRDGPGADDGAGGVSAAGPVQPDTHEQEAA